ncbi:MAG: hypothetical protein ABIT09_12265 [Croceibacterium sp.]
MKPVCHVSLNGPSTAKRYAKALPAESPLIDLFTLALTHGLMALALFRLMFRAELDSEDAPQHGAGRDA